MHENEIATLALDLAFKIHRVTGPGLFESVYEEILCYELNKAGIAFKRQEGIPLVYDNLRMNLGFRADLIVCDKVIIEIKSVECLNEIHFKQVLTYLTLTGLKLGILINFNVAQLKDGIKRVVNHL